jgi:predicted lactoylglutathione lyase
VQLLDHVSISVRSIGKVRPFYAAVMSALRAAQVYDRSDAIGCFRAASKAQVDAFHAAGIAAGGKSEGAPGPRDYHRGYYAAFLLDPEGNKIEAVFHNA